MTLVSIFPFCSEYSGMKPFLRGREVFLGFPNSIIVCAFFLMKGILLLFLAGEMTSVPHLSPGLHAGELPTGSVVLILRTTHPEEALPCFHEAQRGGTGERLECNHDLPLFHLFPPGAPEMLGEKATSLPDLRPLLSFPPDKISFSSLQRSSCKPPPRE